ncbi:MAG: glycine cleavage T C-terminal barrel domain-containing protein [Solirubrobacteraceae bacterium]
MSGAADIVKDLRVAADREASFHPGWGRTPEYTGWRDEQLAWKRTCTLGDWSFLWDIELSGPDALQLLSDSAINSMASFDIGQAKHLVQCNDDGKVIAEGVLLRLGEERFATQSTTAFYTAFLAASGRYDVQWRDRRSFQYQVGGPSSLAVLEDLVGASLRDTGFMRFSPVTIAGHEVLALRQGMSGEIGFELHGEDGADEVYAAVLEAGREHGMRRLGSRTAMVNHLEACFPTGGWHYLADVFTTDGYGRFIFENFDLQGIVRRITGSFDSADVRDWFRSPVELGWGRSIKLDHEFRGRAALEAELAAPKRTVVTLEFSPDDVARVNDSLLEDGPVHDPIEIPLPQRYMVWADQVLRDGELVGISTAPGYSMHFRRVLALAYVDVALSEPGTEVTVLWGNPGTVQTEIRAIVQRAPYKQDNRRADLTAV